MKGEELRCSDAHEGGGEESRGRGVRDGVGARERKMHERSRKKTESASEKELERKWKTG